MTVAPSSTTDRICLRYTSSVTLVPCADQPGDLLDRHPVVGQQGHEAVPQFARGPGRRSCRRVLVASGDTTRQQISGGGLIWGRSNDSQPSQFDEAVFVQLVGQRIESPEIRR